MDAAALRGETIEADLAERDFTVGAVAVPLSGGGPLDPHGGLDDLERRVLRVVGERSFAADPLRLLRAARLAAGLGLEVDPETAALARAEASRAAEPAGERQLVELRQLIGGPDPLRGLSLLDDLALTPVVLPELAELRDVEQGPNHHLDVHGHTLAVLERTLEVESDLERFAGERAEEVRALLEEPLADEMTRGTALRFGACCTTRQAGDARRARRLRHLHRPRSRRGGDRRRPLPAAARQPHADAHLKALTLHHLRLGFLVHEMPLPPRRVHEYLRATEPVGRRRNAAHRCRPPLGPRQRPLRHRGGDRGPPRARPPDARRGARLAPRGPPRRSSRRRAHRRARHRRGPELGDLIAELEAAQYAGEVTSRDAAVQWPLTARIGSRPYDGRRGARDG